MNLSPGVSLALASAVLFGASTPLSKLLLGAGLNPWQLAGLLYLGSGLGLSAIILTRRLAGLQISEAPLQRADLRWLALVVLSGGIVGPVLLMLGLTSTPASAAALLLNTEGLATMGIAWVVFKENVDRRLLIGAFAIIAGATLLSWHADLRGGGLGELAIVGACVAWGIDNNLTRRLSSADPMQVAAVKGLAAGSVNLTLTFSLGAPLPMLSTIIGAGVLGFFSYGVSLVLFVLALRYLGTARTGAYFSIAPFLGATLAVVLFGEPVTTQLIGAALLMGIGIYIHLSERHDHGHVHSAIEHEHRHVHDIHHEHSHSSGDPSGDPHTHRHLHVATYHKHPHYPDAHHRHTHND